MSVQDLIPSSASSLNPRRHRKIKFDSTEPSLASRLSTTPINLQMTCPLFHPSFPAEVRTIIFELALTEDLIAEDKKRNCDNVDHGPQNTDCRCERSMDGADLPHHFSPRCEYWWPGYGGLKKVSCSLLRTCRRVYLETHHLPPALKEHIFWMVNYAPPGMGFCFVKKYFRRFTPAQLENVGTVHLFITQWRLERHLLTTCQLPFLRHIKKFKITVRRCEWATNNEDLSLDARRGYWKPWYRNVNTDLVDDGLVEWNERGWGSALKHMEGLKDFQLQLECEEVDGPVLDATVTKAKQWRFPCYQENHVFSSEGTAVESWTWKRLHPGKSMTDEECEGLQEEWDPVRVVKVVKWKAVPAVEESLRGLTI